MIEPSQKTAISSTSPSIAPIKASGLLAMPQEILDRIAALVVVYPDCVFIRWIGKYKRRLRGDVPSLLNLAKTCRRLYLTCIDQIYASNEFLFMPLVAKHGEVDPTRADPAALTEFIRRIGRNSTKITRINLKGYATDAEFSMLPSLPSLRELRIEVSAWSHAHASLDSFTRGLVGLCPNDVPSLRILFITAEWWTHHGYDDWMDSYRGPGGEIDFGHRCAYIESAVNAVRRFLKREDGTLTVHLREGLTQRSQWGYHEDRYPQSILATRRPRYIVSERVRRDYVSRGMYTSIVRGENIGDFC